MFNPNSLESYHTGLRLNNVTGRRNELVALGLVKPGWDEWNETTNRHNTVWLATKARRTKNKRET